MGLKNPTIGDMRIKENSLVPTVIFPIKIEVDDPRSNFIAALVTMNAWKEYLVDDRTISQSFMMSPYSISNPFNFEFEIPFEKIRWIEAREKDDVGFQFSISILYYHTDRVQIPNITDIYQRNIEIDSNSQTKRISSSDWLNFLNKCGYSDRIFFYLQEEVVNELDKFRKSIDPKLSYDDTIREALRRAKNRDEPNSI